MREIIREYGSMVLALSGTAAFYALINEFLFREDGLIVQMIRMWGNGGC